MEPFFLELYSVFTLSDTQIPSDNFSEKFKPRFFYLYIRVVPLSEQFFFILLFLFYLQIASLLLFYFKVPNSGFSTSLASALPLNYLFFVALKKSQTNSGDKFKIRKTKSIELQITCSCFCSMVLFSMIALIPKSHSLKPPKMIW